MREPAEMRGRILRRNIDDGQRQTPSDHRRNLAERDALLRHAMIARAGRALFLQRQTLKTRRILPLHRRPAITSAIDETGDALLTRHFDQDRHEARFFAEAMHRERQPHH